MVLALLYNHVQIPPTACFRLFRTKETPTAGNPKKGDACCCAFHFQGRHYYFTFGSLPKTQALANGGEVADTLGH